MKREWKGVLSVLTGNKQKVTDYDWYYTLGLLQMNRIGVSFLYAAQEQDIALPKQAERILDSLALQQTERNHVVERWIADFSYSLQTAEVRFAFLKGSVLSYCLFGGKSLYNFGERISNDVDILVHPKDLGKADRVLESFGFVQGAWNAKEKKIVPFSHREILYRRMTRGETAPYLITTQSETVPYIELDMNYSLGYKPSGDEKLVGNMLSDVKGYSFSLGGTIPSLSEEKFLLHLIMHQYKEATLYWMTSRNKDSQLYKYLDIYRVIKSGTIDTKRFLWFVKDMELNEQVYYVLHFCNELFPCEETENMLLKLLPNDFKYLDRVIDEDNKTVYHWTKGIYERTGIYERNRYLKKV